jgi:hypothetical protein
VDRGRSRGEQQYQRRAAWSGGRQDCAQIDVQVGAHRPTTPCFFYLRPDSGTYTFLEYFG